jgi:DNA-directed RNA polymerase specialized sigma24 family protein
METTRVDELLLPFINASDEAEAERQLSRLLTEHAEPTVARIVRYKAGGARAPSRRADELSKAEDVRGDVMLQLVVRLRNFRADYSARPIADFNAYVAVTTYNAYDRHISRLYPQRRRLKNGLRYLLTHRSGFALWQTKDGVWVGGFERWRPDACVEASHAAGGADVSDYGGLQHLREDPRAFATGAGEERHWHDRKHAYELLGAVFEWADVPVDLDLLTGVVADWWNVTDEEVELDAGRDSGRGDGEALQVASGQPAAAVEVESRMYLKRLWDEIAQLPPRQRAALLLNLRDEGGHGIVDLWIIVGVVTPEALAGALNLDARAFAELWKELPLDDNRIAAHLGLTRQQVINLRKSARERLARRVKAF